MNQAHAIAILVLFLMSVPVPASEPDEQTVALIAELGLEESDVPVSSYSWWRKPEKVHIMTNAQGGQGREWQVESAREVAGDVELVAVTYPLSQEVIEEMEVLLGNCTPEIVRGAKNLRWLQDARHGGNLCLIPELREARFILTNTQHTSGPPMAEHVIAMLMTMTRGLHILHGAQLQRVWRRGQIDFPMVEIAGKTMLVAGLGGIGTEVAKRAHALGMRVIATRSSSREGPPFVEYVGLSHELSELSQQADVVVNTLPLTNDTRGLFDREYFATVKPGAWYISVGRGETTVTDDLIAALKSGQLAGAGLDVFDPEPLPPDNELWTMTNVIMTPHVSATTDMEIDRRWTVMKENLRRYINGEKLLNVVDPARGY